MKEEHDLKELNKGKKIRERKLNDKNRVKTEKIIMLASSVMILSGLTATGIYMRANQNQPSENLEIDLSGMEENLDKKATEIIESQTVEDPMNLANSDMDFDPDWKEDVGMSASDYEEFINSVSTEGIAKTHVSDIEAQIDGLFMEEDTKESEVTKAEEDGETFDIVTTDIQDSTVSADAFKPAQLSFSAKDQLSWPIVGTVIMNYSMDSTVYYETLDQYKYQPGMVIAANKGDMISAAATCQVLEISKDSVLGNTVRMDLGSGYEITYGQLEDIRVKEGDVLKQGDVVGFVAQPTKYYSLEGTNLYIEVTKDGEPINPMTLLP